MKKLTHYLQILALIFLLIPSLYFVWQFSWWKIDDFHCWQLNKEYIPKTYTVDQGPGAVNNQKLQIQMQPLQGVKNFKINSTYESVSGIFLYPGMESGCAADLPKNFTYLMKIQGFEEFEMKGRGSYLSLSYDQKKLNYDLDFQKEINSYNWQLTTNNQIAYLESATNFSRLHSKLVQAKLTANGNYSRAFVHFPNSGWGRLNFEQPENLAKLEQMVLEQNLSAITTASLTFADLNDDSGLIMDFYYSVSGNSEVDGQSFKLNLKLKKVGQDYLIEEILVV